MAEQQPFKLFVEGSSPSALIEILQQEDFFVVRPSQGDDIRSPPRSSKSSNRRIFLLCVPAGGMIFDPLRAHRNPPTGGFFCCASPRGDDIRSPPRSSKSSNGRIF